MGYLNLFNSALSHGVEVLFSRCKCPGCFVVKVTDGKKILSTMPYASYSTRADQDEDRLVYANKDSSYVDYRWADILKGNYQSPPIDLAQEGFNGGKLA